MSRVFQWIIIILVLTALGGGYWYWKNARAGQTVATGSSSGRADFEAPLKTNLELTAGSGIATYARADGADRRATVTDFEGLIRPVKQNEARFVGARRVENMLMYSEALDNGVWTKTGVTMTANQGNSPGNTVTADSLSGLNAEADRLEYVTAIVPASRTFVFSVWMSGSGTIHLGMPSLSMSTYDSPQIALSTDWKRYSFSVNFLSTDTGVVVPRIIFRSGDTASSILVWGAQLEEVTGQVNQNPSEYVSANVKTAFPYHGAGVDGVKYFDYQNGNTVATNVVTEASGAAIADATLKGYLAEGSRTNLMIYSEQLDNVVWTKMNATITANTATAPDGHNTADRWNRTSTGSNYIGLGISKSTSAITYTFSAFVKKSVGDYVALRTQGTYPGFAEVVFNIANGTISTAATAANGFTNASATITAAGNGWYRVTLTATTDSAANMTSYLSFNSNGTVIDGNDSSALSEGYLWGTQLEQGIFASSYIPTTTVSVTRAGDNLQYPVLNNFNDSAGTVSLDVTTEWTSGVGFSTKWIDTSVANQRLSIWHWTGSANMIVVDRNGNGGVRNNFDYTGSAITAWTRMSLTQRWTNTANSSFRDGVLSGSDTTLTLPYDPLSGNIYVGRGFNTGDDAFSTIRNVRSWKQAMSDTFINNLTAGQSGVEKKTTEKSSDNTGLVGYWSFEDGRGTQATDFSPAGDNTGTLTNGPTWTDGKMGKAVNFDGADDNISIPSAPSFSGLFTFSTWMYTANNSQTGIIFGDTAGDSSGGPKIGLASGNFFIRLSVDVDNAVISPTQGKWHHVVITRDSANKVDLYIDGGGANRLFGDVAQPSTFVLRRLGSNGNIPDQCFQGKLDEVRIYNRTLSATEITDLYGESAHATINDSRNSILTNGLVGQWSFNGPDVSGTTAYDRSGQGNNGTLTGGPTAIPGKIGQALNFDGVNDYIALPTFNQTFSAATIVAWVKRTGTGDWPGIVFSRGTHTSGMNMMGSSGKLGYHWHSAGSSAYNWDSGLIIPLNQWALVAIAVSATEAKAYLGSDGSVSSATNPISHDPSTLNFVNIGVDQGPPRLFPGSIDEVRIYNRALSLSEINDLYLMGR